MYQQPLTKGRLASDVWTQDEYSALLFHLHSPNPPKRFGASLLGATKTYGIREPRTIHNKTRTIDGAIVSTYESLTGVQHSPYALVLLPSVNPSQSTFIVWDFDFHDHPEDALAEPFKREIQVFEREAKKLAPDGIGYIIEHSGRGWHFWLVADRPIPSNEWKDIRSRVDANADFSGKPEHLPSFKGNGRGCRAPGSVNPNTWHPTREDYKVSHIYAHGLLPSTLELNNKKILLFSSTVPQSDALVGGPLETLLEKWRITAPHQRHNQMLDFIGEGIFQFGKEVLRQGAQRLHEQAAPPCATPLEEHLSEFDIAYTGAWKTILLPKFSPEEQEMLAKLGSQSEVDLFVIAQNYARLRKDGFFLSTKRAGACIGLSFQRVGQMREKFQHLGIIEKLPGGYIPGKKAYSYRWLLPMLPQFTGRTANDTSTPHPPAGVSTHHPALLSLASLPQVHALPPSPLI